MKQLAADLRELRDWMLIHRLEMAVILVFSFLVFGIRLLYHDVGIDSEVAFNNVNQYNLVWCRTGRYGLVLSKKLFGFGYAVPFASNFLMVLFLNLAVLLVAFLTDRWSRGTVDARRFYLVFSALFLSSLILAEQMYFTLQSMEIAWAFVCCALAAYFAARTVFDSPCALGEYPGLWLRHVCGCGCPALIFLIWALATYQAFALVYIITILFSYLLIYSSEGERSFFFWFAAGAKQLILFMGGLLGWQLIGKVITHFYGSLEYTSNMILWKIDPAACVMAVRKAVVQMYTGGADYYQVLFLPVLLLGCAVMLVRALRVRGRGIYCFLTAMVLYILSPAFLFVIMGYGGPMRSRFYYSLAAALAFGYLAGVLRERWIKTAFLLVCTICAWKQVGLSCARQEAAHLAWEADQHLMNRIAGAMEETAGKRLSDVPVVFVGKLAPDLPEGIFAGEVTGRSFFEWDASYYGAGGNQRIIGLAGVMGIQLKAADEEQREAAVDYASEQMPPWPAKDSVQMRDGVLIVKLSSPEKTGERWWYSGGWHYWINDFSESLAANWKEIDGNWYYFDENAVMVTGDYEIDGVTWSFDADGRWIELSD